MQDHKIASHGDWFEAHRAHVAKEKAFTRQRERLAADRRALPWLRIDKPYAFETTEGRRSLADLFAGRSQLVIYHFMFPPNATYRCIGCSLLSDHIDASEQHLRHHDVSLVVCARAPLAASAARRTAGQRRRRLGVRMTDDHGGGVMTGFTVRACPRLSPPAAA